MSLYNKRGVSAQKEEVHAAVKNLDAGLFPKAFCKIYPDFLGQSDDYVNIMHADGAGTKSILAYLYWKETGDISVWKGIAQDAIVMNLDDLLCVGVYDKMVFNSTIDRNKKRIPGEVLELVINGSQDFFDQMAGFGIHIHYLGGETADVGDVVRTIAVNGTITSRWPRKKLITNEKIRGGDVIVGLSGFGTCAYDKEYNSGLGSNGLTSARHDVLSKYYAAQYPETYESVLSDDVVYIGNYKITDKIFSEGQEMTIGKLLLSPTRTFAPVLKTLLEENFDDIHGLIHCSGGGQTKCLKYVPENVRIIKDNLFTPPVIFNVIQQASKAPAKEMYQVFNMGCRLEVYTSEKGADFVMQSAAHYGIEARVIGRVEDAPHKELIIHTAEGELKY